jgi:polygalacturonase
VGNAAWSWWSGSWSWSQLSEVLYENCKQIMVDTAVRVNDNDKVKIMVKDSVIFMDKIMVMVRISVKIMVELRDQVGLYMKIVSRSGSWAGSMSRSWSESQLN